MDSVKAVYGNFWWGGDDVVFGWLRKLGSKVGISGL